eukprot:2501907-Pyramimonas_sp.AAC.1
MGSSLLVQRSWSQQPDCSSGPDLKAAPALARDATWLPRLGAPCRRGASCCRGPPHGALLGLTCAPGAQRWPGRQARRNADRARPRHTGNTEAHEEHPEAHEEHPEAHGEHR